MSFFKKKRLVTLDTPKKGLMSINLWKNIRKSFGRDKENSLIS